MPGFQSKYDYSTYVKGFDTMQGIVIRSASTTAQQGDAATVTVELLSIDSADSRWVPKSFQGTWVLIRVGGAWKLDTPNIRQLN